MGEDIVKNTCTIGFPSVVEEIFEKVNQENCGLFSDFQYGFRSSPSTADLQTVLSDRIVKASNRPGATWTVAFDILKAFHRFWHPCLLHKLESYGISD